MGWPYASIGSPTEPADAYSAGSKPGWFMLAILCQTSDTQEARARRESDAVLTYPLPKGLVQILLTGSACVVLLVP